MGKLTNLNPPPPITDGDLPPSIARDSEITAATNAHIEATDPHKQYANQERGDARYKRLGSETFTSTSRAIATSPGLITATGFNSGNCGLRIEAADSTSGAFVFFNRPGYNLHFGLDSSNQLGIGGGGLGDKFFRVFHEGNPITARAALPPATLGANSTGIGWNSATGTTEICNFPGSGTGDAVGFFRVPGNTSGLPTLANRIARIDTAGAYIQASDKRLKSHLSEAPGLETILLLKPSKYKHWACTGFDTEIQKLKLGKTCTQKVGFIAQEVQRYLPEAVPLTESEEELYGIDYNCILAVSVRAIQELHQAVQEQQRQIIELRTQLQEAISKK